MIYKTQQIAKEYFAAALVLLGFQVLFGLILGAKYVWDHDPLIGALPFNVVRAIHLNLLVVWILLGFMGGTYYLVPEEAKTEIWSVKLARFQLGLFLAVAVAAVAAYILRWSWGMPFLEQPEALKLAIVAVALIFFLNVLMTIMKTGNWTTTQGVLLGGIVLIAGLFLFGIPFMRNLSTQYFWWWWVIHLWVEGAWELVAASIMAFLLMKLTGVDRKVIEKWLYVEVGLVLLSGIAGTGHHYYWIGTPKYWLLVGGFFSALEPVPILFMVIDTLRDVRERKQEIANRTTLVWAVGCSVMHFIGAGVWGFAHTLPAINKWTHGTQITASHGHFAFFGAYVMLNLTMISFVLPNLSRAGSTRRQMRQTPFVLMVSFMILMALAFAIAGIVQTYLQRVLGMDYLVTQGYMKLWYAVLWVSAWGFAIGVAAYIADYFSFGRRRLPEPGA
jgi:nitric oxide reductase subunit B